MKRTDGQEYKNLDLSMVHESWGDFFNSHKDALSLIDNLLQGEITPKREDVFKIFSMPVDKIRFVIVGQDPYPRKGHATGRSFERETGSWNNTNASLKAILSGVHYHQVKCFMPINSLMEEVASGSWSVPSPSKLFKQWEEEKGVFFLNKSLTTKLDVRNGHSDIWSSFIAELVNYMSNMLDVKWLLWGNEAQKLEANIKTESTVVKSIHPAAYSYSGGAESENRLVQFITKSGLDLICK